MGHAMSESWSADRIEDDTYRTKFINVPNIIADWLRDHGGFAGRDVLDFGCGEATTALGIALRHSAHRVVGVEIHEEIDNALPYAKAQLGLARLPENLELVRLGPDSSLDAIGTFDVVYSWSVFEHVRQDLIVDCFAKIKRVLRPHGVMFLQTTPLFYSAEGSHMKPWVPAPWAHLTMQQDLFYAALRERTNSQDQADELQWVYETLNRVTAPQLLRAVKQAGFEIVREYRTYDELPVPAELKEIYTEDVLTTNQLVFLARHAVPATVCALEEGITPPFCRSSKPARMETEVSPDKAEAAMLPACLTHETVDQAEAQLADLLQRYEELCTSLDAAQGNLMRASTDIAQLDQALAAMRASLSWRITQPLRMVKHHVRKVLPISGRTKVKTQGNE
jgi:SAM-dependent methyltransferase